MKKIGRPSRKRKKLKIRARKKAYLIQDSPFFRLNSKKKLSELLLSDLTDLKSLSSDSNYRVFNVNSSGKPREIQQPLPRLDVVHTRIASLLCRVRPPEYLYSGVKGRTYVDNARAHLGDHPVLTTDIRAFFTSTKQEAIFRFFHRQMECSPDVAKLISRLATYNGHVPTGSRLSLPIAFWANFEMFEVLNALSAKQSIKMTVFVDDLTFSGVNVTKKIYTPSFKDCSILWPCRARR